jgi:hypothetical protein
MELEAPRRWLNFKPEPQPRSIMREILAPLPALLAFTAGLLSSAFAAAPDRPKDVIVPREVIRLFNGKDLSGFYTWLPKFGRADPDKVFTVVDRIDGAPAVRASGQHYGGFVTLANYADYKLVLEYRWGDVTWKPRDDRARDSGILIHGQG